MTRYVAFLRGINVGGNKLIKMEHLARIFTEAGFKNVRTYIASGNVIFDSSSTSKTALTRKIEKVLLNALGYEVKVVLRTLSELEALVSRNAVGKRQTSKDVYLFVVLLGGEPKNKVEIPLISTKENFEVFEVSNGAAFIEARRKKTGWFGYPNNFIEKEFGVVGTTRNWSTLNKILKAAEK